MVTVVLVAHLVEANDPRLNEEVTLAQIPLSVCESNAAHECPIITEETTAAAAVQDKEKAELTAESTKEIIKKFLSAIKECWNLGYDAAMLGLHQRGQVHAHIERVGRIVDVLMLNFQTGVWASQVLEQAGTSINAVLDQYEKERGEMENPPTSWARFDHALHNLENKLKTISSQMSKGIIGTGHAGSSADE